MTLCNVKEVCNDHNDKPTENSEITSLCSSPWLNRALKHISSHCFHFLDHKLTAYCLLLTAWFE